MIVLGRISAPFGIRGWVKLQVFGDDPLAWAHMPQWWLAADEHVFVKDWPATQISAGRINVTRLVALLI